MRKLKHRLDVLGKPLGQLPIPIRQLDSPPLSLLLQCRTFDRPLLFVVGCHPLNPGVGRRPLFERGQSSIYELLEAAGIVPYLVNARHLKTVPGRKSDWNDAQWLQKLHALGLLAASFRPDAEIAALRTLVGYRSELIQHRAPHILHMQKALQQMNIHQERVLSDIMAVTG